MTLRTQDLAKTGFTAVLANPRKRLRITHPGKYLETEFMVPHKLSANALANLLHAPANRITAILKGQRAITADTALRLARYLGTSAELWLNLQKDYELRTAREEIAAKIDTLVEPMAAWIAHGQVKARKYLVVRPRGILRKIPLEFATVFSCGRRLLTNVGIHLAFEFKQSKYWGQRLYGLFYRIAKKRQKHEAFAKCIVFVRWKIR